MQVKSYFAEPLAVTRRQIESEERFHMRVVGDHFELWRALAEDFCSLIRHNQASGRNTRLILSPRWLNLRALAERLITEEIDCRRLVVFHPEELCDEQHRRVSRDHPYSVTGHVWRELWGRLDRSQRPLERNLIFPDPQHPGEFGARLTDAGGAHACYAAVGIKAHLGFHAAPGAREPHDDRYFELPARVITLSPETREEAEREFSGDDSGPLPPHAVCCGLSDIMCSDTIRLFLGYPWQSAALRHAFYGPVMTSYPASILQQHPEVQVTMIPEVAEPPAES